MTTNTRLRTKSATALLAASVVVAAYPLSGQERLTKPATRPSFGGLTVVPAGPTFIDAASDWPTNIRVMWAAVPNAVWYRITRWSTAEPKRYWDVDAARLNTTTQPGYVLWNNQQVAVDPTYSYQVQGIVNDANGNPLLTGVSATASARSVPFLAPANLYLVVSPSAVQHELRLTLTWDAVPAASFYYLTGTEKSPRATYIIPGKSIVSAANVVVFDDPTASHPAYPGYFFPYRIVAGNTYTLCMVTYYPNAHDDTVQKCASITP